MEKLCGNACVQKYIYMVKYGTHHASLKSLHIVKLMLWVKHIMQVTQSQCPSVPSSDTACMSVSHSLTLRLSVSLSALTLSVIAGCVPAYLSGHLFAVSDSRSCLYLTVDDVLFCLCVWVMSFRCSVPGQRAQVSPHSPSLLPFLLSSDTLQPGFSGDACTCACKNTCNVSMSTGMHLCTLDGMVKGCYAVGPVVQCDLWHCCGQIVRCFK